MTSEETGQKSVSNNTPIKRCQAVYSSSRKCVSPADNRGAVIAGLRLCDCDHSSHNRGKKEHASSQRFSARRRGGSPGLEGEISVGGRSTKAAEEESGWKGIAGKGQADESTRLLLLCKCWQQLLGQGEAPDWWAGLNCKVHFWLVATARLWTVTQGRGGR